MSDELPGREGGLRGRIKLTVRETQLPTQYPHGDERPATVLGDC